MPGRGPGGVLELSGGVRGASWEGLDLPFPLPSASGELGHRKWHSFLGLSKPHFFHLIFLLLFYSLLARSWAPSWSLLGTQDGSILAQDAPKSPLEASCCAKVEFPLKN